MLQLDLTKEFVGKRALVTGSSRGIGGAVAQRLAVGKGLTIPEPFPHRKHFKGIIKATVGLDDLHDKATAA